MARILALLILVAAVTRAAAGERFPILQPDQMNADQKMLLEALLAGPRGGGNTSPEAVQKMLRGGPFNGWMRSPDLGNRLQNVSNGFATDLAAAAPQRVRDPDHRARMDLAIRMDAHYPLAMKAGLDGRVADELALGKRPSAMSDDEARFTGSHPASPHPNVDDATFNRALALFGERGVVDLIGVSGYYTAVSMTLNVAQVMPPKGTPLPLK